MELSAEDDVLEEQSPAPPTDGTVMVVQASSDLWCRRLGHTHFRAMENPRKIQDGGVEYSGQITGRDICPVGKKQ